MHFEQGERKSTGSLGPDVMGGPGRAGDGEGIAEWSWPEVCDVWRPSEPDLPPPARKKNTSLASAVLVLFWSLLLPLIPSFPTLLEIIEKNCVISIDYM